DHFDHDTPVVRGVLLFRLRTSKLPKVAAGATAAAVASTYASLAPRWLAVGAGASIAWIGPAGPGQRRVGPASAGRPPPGWHRRLAGRGGTPMSRPRPGAAPAYLGLSGPSLRKSVMMASSTTRSVASSS